MFWAVAIVNVLPLFAVRHLPFTDLPEHVAAIATVERLLPGGGGAPYVLALRESQYLLYHLCGAVLARVVGDAVIANKLLLALVAIATPLSLRSLLRALGRDERVAIFGAMVFWNRALTVGFLPFVASLPLALFALAAVVEQCRAPTTRRALALSVLAIVLFYTHASAYVVFVLATGAVATASCRTERAGDAGWTWRPLRTTLPFLVPSVLAALLWWSAGSLATHGHDPEVARMAVSDTVNSLPIWTFDIWTGHLDEVAAGLWWLAFALIVAAGLRQPLEPRGRGLLATLPFAVTLVVFFATPNRVGAAGYLNVRLAPLVTLLALGTLRPRADRWGKGPLALAAVATVVMAATSALEARAVARERLGDFDALLATMAPGKRLAMLNFQIRSPRTHEWPYVFAGSLYRASGGAVAGYSFVELPHWPVHYAPGEAPPLRHPFWVYDPCAYRFVGDGAYYDYLLVQGPVDPFDPRATPLGPPFVERASVAAFTLYERASGPPSAPEGVVDHGPCIPRPPPGTDGYGGYP